MGAPMVLPRRASPTSSSMASCAESTAEPRSTSTSTPSPSSTASMASAIRVASVPMPPSSVPPAARIRTSGAICPASSTTPSATLAEWETTTKPTLTGPHPLSSTRGPPHGAGVRSCRTPLDHYALGLIALSSITKRKPCITVGLVLREPLGARMRARRLLAALVLERHLDPGAVGAHLAVLEVHVELEDLGDAQVPERP